MTRGKKLPCPKIVVFTAEQPRFASRDEAWQEIGPLLADILAQAIKSEMNEEQSAKPPSKSSPKPAF